MNFKSKFIIFLLILCIFSTLTCVSANDNQTEVLADNPDYHSFSDLNQSISESEDELELKYDYQYDDFKIFLNKSNEFTINGNNHEINGITGNSSFLINSGDIVTINNLTFRNCTNALLMLKSSVVFNNVKFIDCSGEKAFKSFIYSSNGNLTFNNCVFNMMDGSYSAVINDGPQLIINNSLFEGGKFDCSLISASRINLIIENTTFANMTPRCAVDYLGRNLTVKNSKFLNIDSRFSAGGIMGKFFPKEKYDHFLIEDCLFSNVSSANDGGAIYFDLNSGSEGKLQVLDIFNCEFNDCSAKFGGAILNIGGVLNIVNSSITNNFAGFEGGAIYTTCGDVNIVHSIISNNSASKNAGALYFDMGTLSILNSNLTNNKVLTESDNGVNGIFGNDININLDNVIFDNGGIGFYANFAGKPILKNITQNNDIFSLNNTDYIVYVENPGIKLNLTTNSIVVDKLPSMFDSRDWGWITPSKIQGNNDDCWAFATVASIESSLLKSTGTSFNLSQNFVQQYQLKYDVNGDLRNIFTGFSYSGLGYALSWNGALLMKTHYDDRGLVGKADNNESRIHIQDALIIFGGQNDTDTLLKQAIMKYGSATVQIIDGSSSKGLNFTDGNIAVMDHATHFISVIGWNDNLSGENNTQGVWLTKDSLTGFDKSPYSIREWFGIDKFAIVPQQVAVAYIFENNIDYHVNYQTDLTGLTGFDGNYTQYSNEFTSKYDELIGAVGTYFNGSGIDYSFDVYVNGKLMHTQKGVSEFSGFRTIVLNKYIPVKTGDVFKVVFKSNALPYQAYSRTHYVEGMTFVSADGENWMDFTLQNKTVCLKVYTVADDTKITANKNISVDYSGGSYFSVKVGTADGRAVGAGESVKFTINGKIKTVKTDNNGVARIKITQLPKTYTIKTTYKGKTVKNTVKVKQVLSAYKATVKKTAKKFTLKAKLKINGKLVKNKIIKFKFRGKTYKAKTNSKGIAQVTIKKSVISKLKKGKSYSVKVTYLKDTIKSTVKVK